VTTHDSSTDWLALARELGARFEEGVDQRDRDDAFVADHYLLLKERGLISALVPPDLGGGGAAYSTVAEMLRTLGRCDPSTALALSMHQHLLAFQVFNHRHGRPAPILSRVAAEQLVLVSTGARDWLESNGTLVPAEGGFRLTARKAFASGSPVGDVLVTSAPYEDPVEGWQVLHFAVSMRAEGVSLLDDWQVHGMRATGSQTVALDGVFIPDASITIRRPRGVYHEVFSVIATVALPLVMGVYLGAAERAADLAVGMAQSNARSPEVQWSIGEMRSHLAVARVCWERAVALADELDCSPTVELADEALMMKSRIAEATRATVDSAMEATGGRGFFRRNSLERLLRDVRAGHYHPLPVKEQFRFSGRVALGLDPYEVPQR